MTQKHTIKISVKTNYLDQHSQPEKQRYAFSYTITIENQSNTGTQLLSRHWIIRDANNTVRSYWRWCYWRTALYSPGDKYTYSSGAVLKLKLVQWRMLHHEN